SMKIAIASGKGGTGKSTVAANLAYTLARSREVALVDCDVEEPNLHLFFPAPAVDVPVTTPVPEIDLGSCTFCGECGKFCRFGALSVLKDRVILFPELCHSCGGCSLVCPQGAIGEVPRTVGRVACSRPLPALTLISGVLNEGEVQAPTVIRATKMLAEGHPLILYDASPGIACPVIETLEGSDVCVLERGLPILMTIPFSREIAAVQNRGGLICRDLPGWEERFAGLFAEIVKIAGVSL
ncbi:MAG: Cobyrinic acid a,c-diamide synthase, partial [Methanoculleus marisnigri]